MLNTACCTADCIHFGVFVSFKISEQLDHATFSETSQKVYEFFLIKNSIKFQILIF